ncbi:MAG: rRNA pseudouridine synthase [Treponema sp.]|nr:rRNA pseudouridine synthase [Treponema sp.]
MSHAGVASRRASEEIIASGRVSVNGQVISSRGFIVAETDKVFLDGKPVKPENRKLYLALNKPPGYICSSSDPQKRPLALSLFPQDIKERLYSVGRLDLLSSGLILFTNDGDFALKLGHPSSNLEKEYIIEATGIIKDEVIDAFNSGITIEGVYYKAKLAQRIGQKALRIILIEGKNREIRRVFSYFHLHPKFLRRVRIGAVGLGALPEGEYRFLTFEEIHKLSKKG